MKISIASYAFHGLLAEGKMDVFGYLESCKYRYGLNAADIWNGTLGKKTDEALARKVRQVLDEHELTLANFCVDGAHLWEDDASAREKNYQNALAHLNAGEIMGAKTIRIDMGGRGLESFTNEQFDYVVKRYREYAQRAYDNGYRVGPETHWGPSLTVEVQRKVHEAVAHPGYGVLLHVGRWNGGPEMADRGDRMAAAFTMHTHVDPVIAAGPLEEKMRILLDAGYTGYWGIEHGVGRNEHEEAAWVVASVRRQLARFANPAPERKESPK